MITRLGLQRSSLADYPGALACVLFTVGCDFRCPWCHNPELVEPEPGDPGLLPVGEVLGFLDKRKRVLSGAVLSGGEPCLHPDLPRLADAVRKRGLKVKLDTNGSFPDALAEVRADYVAIDVKARAADYPKLAPLVPDAAERVARSLGWLRSSGTPFEVRVTAAPGFVDPDTAAIVAEFLEADDEVVLQQFRPLRTLESAWQTVEPHGDAALAEILAALKHRSPKARLRGG
ncbi:MAG: anaerobic ribonucleoside-triphosphate reductase activating protein [Spirochaetales bacterium]|nr:anaerobic ribonucleoside-triphosphate reductase activating protein [Spirochaetales bacterium]